jgi:hypothetical protein
MEEPFGPGRDALVRLREMLLSAAPRAEVDVAIFRTLDPGGSGRFPALRRGCSQFLRVEDWRCRSRQDRVDLLRHELCPSEFRNEYVHCSSVWLIRYRRGSTVQAKTNGRARVVKGA